MPLARVKFFDAAGGGRLTPPESGFRPQIGINELHTSCTVESVEGKRTFPFNTEHRVSLKLMFPERYLDAFHVNDFVRFYEGNKIIGKGVIVEL